MLLKASATGLPAAAPEVTVHVVTVSPLHTDMRSSHLRLPWHRSLHKHNAHPQLDPHIQRGRGLWFWMSPQVKRPSGMWCLDGCVVLPPPITIFKLCYTLVRLNIFIFYREHVQQPHRIPTLGNTKVPQCPIVHVTLFVISHISATLMNCESVITPSTNVYLPRYIFILVPFSIATG